jgi:hypothetical protein
MSEKICQNCQYYRQHYGISGGRIYKVFCGHCTAGKLKVKRPWTKCCTNYIYAPPAEDAFVSKEYLSKALLQRVLNMELLPPIENGEDDMQGR